MTENFFHIDAFNAMASLMRPWRMDNALNQSGFGVAYYPPRNSLILSNF